jgi:PKHD-type hydroxylase
MRGARLVCIFWVESLVRNPARRKILFDLACVLEYLDREHEPAQFVEVLRRCQLNLVRLWAKT